MDTFLQDLLKVVERYLKRTGLTATAFGLLTVRDRALVFRMRQGKPITSRNMSVIRAYMAENPPVPKVKKSEKV